MWWSFGFYTAGMLGWIAFVITVLVKSNPIFEWWYWFLWAISVALFGAVYLGILELYKILTSKKEEKEEENNG